MIWLMNYAQAGGSLMPAPATEIAGEVSGLYNFLLIASLISCAILIGGMIYFALKYKRKTNNDKTAYITHNTALEFLWSFIPLVIFMVVFAWGWKIYHNMRTMPKDALEVHVVAKQWAWEMQYKSGVKASNMLMVPVNKNVKITLSSQDVIHSFYVPTFRIKQDAVPGMYTNVWFKAEKLGDFHIFCTEYCGTAHSGMLGKVKVVTQEEFDKWLEDESKSSALPLAQRGEKIFQVKACGSCHSDKDASTKVGPSLFKKFGAQENLEGGSSVTVDENYVRESVLNPAAKIVKGFQPVMPSFQGQLEEAELNALIEYIKSLK